MITSAPAPAVTIILPTYNGDTSVGAAIESVQAQTFLDWQLVVVDDASTDETARIIKTYQDTDPRIILLSNERNCGIQRALNRGLATAQGTYIGRIDDDDRWIDPTKLERQVTFLSDHPDHVLVGTGAIVVDETGREIFRYYLPETDQAIRARMLQKNCFVHSSVLFVREVAVLVRGYTESPEVLHIEDYDLWLKLGQKGKVHNMPTYGVCFMMHTSSISSTHRLAQRTRAISLIKKYKNSYPYFTIAIIKAYARLWGQYLYALLPSSVQHFIFMVDKKY